MLATDHEDTTLLWTAKRVGAHVRWFCTSVRWFVRGRARVRAVEAHLQHFSDDESE